MKSSIRPPKVLLVFPLLSVSGMGFLVFGCLALCFVLYVAFSSLRRVLPPPLQFFALCLSHCHHCRCLFCAFCFVAIVNVINVCFLCCSWCGAGGSGAATFCVHFPCYFSFTLLRRFARSFCCVGFQPVRRAKGEGGECPYRHIHAYIHTCMCVRWLGCRLRSVLCCTFLPVC